MLQNAYLLAKIGSDTAENERNLAEVLPKIGNYPTGPEDEKAASFSASAPARKRKRRLRTRTVNEIGLLVLIDFSELFKEN